MQMLTTPVNNPLLPKLYKFLTQRTSILYIEGGHHDAVCFVSAKLIFKVENWKTFPESWDGMDMRYRWYIEWRKVPRYNGKMRLASGNTFAEFVVGVLDALQEQA
jgi:hypothetical protein